MKFDERNPNFFQIPPFLFPIFLAYFVPLDVDVTGNIIAKICEVWSEFNIFGTLVTNFKWHMIFLQCFIKFDQGISEKSSGQKCVEE
jgi:hypothetical protein